jgi:hypothetical protein
VHIAGKNKKKEKRRKEKHFTAEKLKNVVFHDNQTTLPRGVNKVRLANMIVNASGTDDRHMKKKRIR